MKNKWLKWKIAAIAVGVITFSATFAGAQEQRVQKKLIASGWDQPDTATLRKNLSLMEQSPFDGVVVDVKGMDEQGTARKTFYAFSTFEWKKEWFQSSIDDLKAIHSNKLTDNFVLVGNFPGNVDFFDDAGWKQVADHWRIAAEIAKEGNLKGILFDTEPYGGQQFNYPWQKNKFKTQHTLTEYQAKARQRGREIMQAIAAVDPNLVILTYWMDSSNIDAATSTNPQAALQLAVDGLLPSFINGWLDVIPPTMTLVDGNEHAYHYNSEMDYLKSANEMRNTALNMVPPEDRAKYIAQVQPSFGFYLDGYIVPSTSPWYIDSEGSPPTLRLHQNVSLALNAAAEYVWIYGEHCRWWPTDNKSVTEKTWEEALPGIDDALLSITHPDQLAEQKIAALEKSGQLVDLLKNGNFSEAGKTKEGIATDTSANWGLWQGKKSQGTATLDRTVNYGEGDKGSLQLAGVSDGAVLQSVPVAEGGIYAIQGWIRKTNRQEEQAAVSVRVSIGGTVAVLVPDVDSAAKDGWQKVQAVVVAPAKANKLNIALGRKTRGQTTANDMTWFDDFHIYKIGQIG